MMKIIILMIYGCFLLTQTNAQNNEVKGTVLFHNSNRKPAKNVKVMGLGSNTVYSTMSGQFVLKYAYKKAGDVAGISIGDVDKYNNHLELVNLEVVKAMRIPLKSEEHHYIIVCKAGQLNEAKEYYYKICDSTIRKKYVALKAEREALQVKAKTDYRQIMLLQTEIDSLDKQLQQSLTRVDDLVDYIASLNKDFASEIVKNALNELEKNNDIEAALAMLSNKKLDESYNAALKQKEAAESEIWVVVNGYLLKGKLLQMQFKYQDIIVCCNKVIDILTENNLSKSFLASIYSILGNTYFNIGNYEEAINYYYQAISIYNHEPLSKQYITQNLFCISNAYEKLARYDKAIQAVSKVYEVDTPNFETLSSIYMHLSNIYLEADLIDGHIDSALSYQLSSLKIMDSILHRPSDQLCNNYGCLGLIYNKLGKKDEALKYHKKVAEIRQKYTPNAPEIAITYSNISITYGEMGQNDSSLNYALKTLRILEEQYHPLHPQVAAMYINIGSIYGSLLNDDSSSLAYYQKATDIYESTLDTNAFDLGNSYRLIALASNGLKSYGQAIEYKLKAVRIFEKFYNKNSPELANEYAQLAKFYLNLKDSSKALAYISKALQILENNTNAKNDYLLNAYDVAIYVHFLLGNSEKVFQYLKKKPQLLSKYNNKIDLAKAYDDIASYYHYYKRYDSVLHFQRTALEMVKGIDDSTTQLYTYYLGVSYYFLRDYDKAIQYYNVVSNSNLIEIKNTYYHNLGNALLKNKQIQQAQQAFSNYEAQGIDTMYVSRNWAAYYGAVKDNEKCLEYLEKAISEGYSDIEWLTNEESINAIRTDKRYFELIRKINLNK